MSAGGPAHTHTRSGVGISRLGFGSCLSSAASARTSNAERARQTLFKGITRRPPSVGEGVGRLSFDTVWVREDETHRDVPHIVGP